MADGHSVVVLHLIGEEEDGDGEERRARLDVQRIVEGGSAE
jgi:hypothetical protein